MINFIPELKARGNPSTIMNFLVPVIAVALTVVTGSIIFALMGFDPFFALHTFFISPISNSYGISELLVKATPLALIGVGLAFCFKNNLYNINTFLLCVMFILIGFSSWLMIPIRSNANTVINENSPSDARALLAYYNLEQYPETHLFYGPMFSDAYAGQDSENPYKDDKPKYERDEKTKKYFIVNDWESGKINSNSDHVGFLPRMWSSEHAVNYMNYFGLLEFTIKPEYLGESNFKKLVNDFKQSVNEGEIDAEGYHKFLTQYGGYLDISKPSLLSNLEYLFNYQIGSMYFRYLMWNFSGRQNDVKWENDLLNGNWISGIKFIDEFRLGPQSNLPDDAKNNKARNTYYMLPFILGLIGFLFLFR